jgi:glycosyltransferase involved in cell wall biosynthesis
MKIIFITLGRTVKIDVHGIYSDLMRKFHKEGHELYIVYPCERREDLPTSLEEEDGVHYLRVKTLNIQKTNVVEKGIGTILVETQFKRAINKHFKGIHFDLILYSTPPITFPNLIGDLKKSNPKATTYLMLKDIFPQNAVDLGMFSEASLFYKYFRSKEKKLYRNTDYIGCMSPANVNYIIKNNPEIDKTHVEVCPNSLELVHEGKQYNHREETMRRYGIPTNCPVFLYGGNLGKPQGIDFLIKAIAANSNRDDCHFLIVGDGTEYRKLEAWIVESQPSNVTLINRLPKDQYDELVSFCNVGLICLDHRFTIPNFPSRLLAYLENHIPVIVATDPNCDMGPIAQQNGFGYWCESNSEAAFTDCVNTMLGSDIKAMGEAGYKYLCDNYLVDNTYQAIMKHFE